MKLRNPALNKIDYALPVSVRKGDRAGIKAALVRLGLVRKFVTGVKKK